MLPIIFSYIILHSFCSFHYPTSNTTNLILPLNYAMSTTTSSRSTTRNRCSHHPIRRVWVPKHSVQSSSCENEQCFENQPYLFSNQCSRSLDISRQRFDEKQCIYNLFEKPKHRFANVPHLAL